MGKTGDIIKGTEIGHKGTNNYIWLVCFVCGKGKWIRYIKNKVKPYRCHTCSFTKEYRENASRTRKGMVFTKEWRKNISDGLTGRSFSEEHRGNLSKANKGKRLSEETKIKMSKAQRMEKNHMWNGGTTIINGRLHFKVPEGCRFSSMKDHHGYVRMHRLVMAEYLQRPLREEEVVHHIDKNIKNNNIENLMLFASEGEHSSYHWRIRRENNA